MSGIVFPIVFGGGKGNAGSGNGDATEITLDPSALEFTEKEQTFDYTQSGVKTIAVTTQGDKAGRLIYGTWLADGTQITKPSDMEDYSGLFVGNNYTPSNGDILDLYFCTLRLEGGIVVRLNAINLGGGIAPSSITITGYSGLGLNAYVDIDLSDGGFGANDGVSPILVGDVSIYNFQPDGATALSISSVTNTSNTALVGGETTIRCFLSITGTPTGNESFEIRPTGAASIYNATGTAMADTETTGAATLVNEASSISITNYGMAADNSFVDIYFSRGAWGNSGNTIPVSLAMLQITNASYGGVTNASISSITNNSGGALVGGETIIRCVLSITGTSDNTERFEIQPIDSISIYDSSANALASTATTEQIPLFKQGTAVSLSFNPAQLNNLTEVGTIYTATGASWDNYGLAVESVLGSGYIQSDILVASTDVSLIGFNTSQINENFPNYEEYVFQNGVNVFYGTLGTNTQAPFVPNNNSKMRLTRNGNKTIALFSTDNGGVFRKIAVSARIDTSTYYCMISARNSGERCVNPKRLV